MNHIFQSPFLNHLISEIYVNRRRLPAFSVGRRKLREYQNRRDFDFLFSKGYTILGYGCCFATLHSTSPMHASECGRTISFTYTYKYFVMMLLIMFMYEFRSDHRNYNHMRNVHYNSLADSDRPIGIHIYFYCYCYECFI